MIIVSDIHKKVISLLEKNKTEYDLVVNQPMGVYTDPQVEENAVSTSLVKLGDGYCLVVYLASATLDLDAVASLGNEGQVRLADHTETFQRVGVESNIIPPFGHLLGLPTYLDKNIEKLPWIEFQAGSHTQSIRIMKENYLKLEPIYKVGKVTED